MGCRTQPESRPMDAALVKNRLALLLDHFGEVPDPRDPAKVRFPLREVLFLATCATVAGCDDYDEIAAWGELNLSFLRRYSEYFFGVPGEDWLRTLLNRIDPALFEACFTAWALSLRPDAPDLIALDGKTLRRSGDSGLAQAPLHLVSAWASTQQLVLAQEPVDAKENECAAILQILSRLSIKGALVTIDAIATNPEIARRVTEAGGDYLLALKSNQPTLQREVEAYFKDALRAELETIETIDKDHGRIETRITSVSRNVSWLFPEEKRRHPHRAARQAHRGGPLLHLLRPAEPRARAAGHPLPLGRGKPPLGARRRLQRRPLASAPRPWRTQHGPRATLRLQHGPPRARQAIHQDRSQGRRMEPGSTRRNHPAAEPLTWTRCRGYEAP